MGGWGGGRGDGDCEFHRQPVDLCQTGSRRAPVDGNHRAVGKVSYRSGIASASLSLPEANGVLGLACNDVVTRRRGGLYRCAVVYYASCSHRSRVLWAEASSVSRMKP